MKNNTAFATLWAGLTDFFAFSPRRLSFIFLLMLGQSLTAGIGLLFIMPLLQIVGFDTGLSSSLGIANSANALFETFHITPNLPIILGCYVLIVTFIATLRLFLSIQSASIQQAYISHLRNRLYRQLLYSRWQFIVQHKMSDFIHCLTGQVQAVGHASHLILNMASQLLVISVMVSLSFMLSWQMTSLAVGFALLLLGLILPLHRIIVGSGQKQLVGFKTIFQMLTEQLGSLKMIKSFASEAYYAEQMQHISETLEIQQVQLTRINAFSQWLNLVGAVITFSLFFYLGQEVFSLPLTITLLLLVIFARLLPQISSLQQTWQQLLHKAPAFADIANLTSLCKQAQEPAGIEATTPMLTQAIRLEKITYCYPGKTRPVFNDFSFQINKNQTVALVGPSGAGKSTLADLIAGLLEADSGQIYCDDTLLTAELRLAWRRKIAYVTQDIFLFNDTIRANLSWVSNKAEDDNALWQALELAAASDFVAALPQGLDTLIGDRGVRLSGGEKQRLALARALLARPQLLILDEATSSLDPNNEIRIQQALKQLQGKLTILIIAHRETTIAHANQRVELSETYITPDISKQTPFEKSGC